MVSPRLRVSEAPSEYEISRSSRWIRLPLIRSYYTQMHTCEEYFGLETSAFQHSTMFPHHASTFINLENSQPRCLELMIMQDDVKHISLTPLHVDISTWDWYLPSQELHNYRVCWHESVTEIGTEHLPRIISRFQ